MSADLPPTGGRPDMSGAHTPAPLKPCDVFSEEIHLLADRELGPAESSVVEEHLADCPRCQALAMHLERMSSVLKAWDAQANDVEAPALRLKNAVLARVVEQSVRRRRDDRLIRVMHYATAAMVVLGLGLGLFLGLTHRAPTVVVPEVAISEAPMPLDTISPAAGIAVRPGAFVEPYTADDIRAGVRVPVRDELETFEPAAPWDRTLWKRRSDDGVPLLVERFVRMEALEIRLGVRVMFWNGPAADKSGDHRRDDPLVTESALNYLHRKGILKRWMEVATPRSPTIATEPMLATARRSTGVTALTMLSPMPGIDRDLRALKGRPPMIRVYTPKQPGSAAAARKGTRSGARSVANVPVLDAWALRREQGGMRSGFDPARVKFADPVAANANEQLHFAESGQGANTVVMIVKSTREPIYIPAGQFLTGGIADRVIAHPVWIPPTRGNKPFIIHCRVVQNFEHGDASAPLSLQREIAGPTIRALLAGGASPRQLKAAAGRIVAAVNGQKGRMLGNWSLYRLHAGMHVRVMATIGRTGAAGSRVDWDSLQGFVVTDPQGRFVGSEIVRPSGPAAIELLRRLWVSYSLESIHRIAAAERGGLAAESFAAPSDGLAQVLRRLGTHQGKFHTPPGVEQPEGARVSALDVVAAGVQLHALEVAGSAAIVSTLSSAP